MPYALQMLPPQALPTQQLQVLGAVASAAARRQRTRCGECEACQTKSDCGGCPHCRDKPIHGGKGIKKQACSKRICKQPIHIYPKPRVASQRIKCGTCEGCIRVDDCDTCANCRDKPRNGGRGVKKQACFRRQCRRGASFVQARQPESAAFMRISASHAMFPSAFTPFYQANPVELTPSSSAEPAVTTVSQATQTCSSSASPSSSRAPSPPRDEVVAPSATADRP